MGPKCNIDNIAASTIFPKIAGWLNADEERLFLEKFTPYVFYETWGTKTSRECYCTVCNEIYTVYKDENRRFFGQHHNDNCCCPHCGSEVQLKSLGRMKSGAGLRESAAAAFIRPSGDGGVFITAGIGFRTFDFYSGFVQPELEYLEKAKYYLAPGKVKGWKRSIGNYFGRCMFGCGAWEATKTIREPFQANAMYGHDNDYWLFGTECLADTDFKYCQLEEWYNEETAVWLSECQDTVKLAISYLANYAIYPQMEMATKLGLGRLCTELCEGQKNGRVVKWSAKSLPEFLRMPKADVKVFMQNPSVEVLKAYSATKGAKGAPSMQVLSMAVGLLGNKYFGLAVECAKRAGVSTEKAVSYVQTKDPRRTVQEWKDYLDIATKLGYDLTRPDVTMPKNLTERHDAAAAALQAERDAEAMKAYKKRYKQLKKKYEFEMDGLRIIVPVSGTEIVREGKTLEHCVGGYAARHLSGATTILFLRRSRKPGTSFATIQMGGMKGNDIVQAYGYRNDRYKNAVSIRTRYQNFIDTWLEWLRQGSKRNSAGKPILNQEVKTA